MSTDRRVHTDNIADEIFTEKDLRQRTGEKSSKWGRYVLKELLDNSLDHMDEGQTPLIGVELEVRKGRYGSKVVSSIRVTDNGPGIPEDTLEQILGDISSFTGTKKHYCLPSRGNQGNALMTLLGIQYLCDGPLRIETNGCEYRVTATNDAREGGYVTTIDKVGESDVNTGTSVVVDFGDKDTTYTRSNRVLNTFYEFVAINPEPKFDLVVNDEKADSFSASPNQTGSSLSLRGATTGKVTWFSPNDFVARLEADVGVEPNLSISEFVKEFCGLRSKASDVIDDLPEGIDTINDLFDDKGQLRGEIAGILYRNMANETSPYGDGGLGNTLGSIGKNLKVRTGNYANRNGSPKDVLDHLQQSESTAEYENIRDIIMYYGDGDVLKSKENDDLDKNIPFYFELCVIPTQIVEEEERPESNVAFGINQSVSYSTPSFSKLKYKGRKEQTCRHISDAFERLGHDFTIVCNLTCPNIDFQDRGKQTFNTNPFTEVIGDVIGKAVRKIRRDIRPDLNKLRTSTEEDDPTLDNKAKHGFISNFIESNFWNVYNKASNDGEFDLEMRQFFYAMREPLLAEGNKRGYKYSSTASPENKTPFELKEGTFRNNVDKFEEEEIGYRLIQRDDRGFFVEPHTGKRVHLGTAAVQAYEPQIDQYSALLFIEKTGFIGTIQQLEIAQKYDIGVVNAKGYATGAARDLVQKIQSEAQKQDREIPMYTLTDLDIAGLGIASDAKETDELSAIDVLDVERIGMTLDDIDEYGLQIENSFTYGQKMMNQCENGYDEGTVTDEQYKFLTKDGGQRLEINALNPMEFGQYLEDTFEELGIEKVQAEEDDDISTADIDDPEELRDETIREAIGDRVIDELWNTEGVDEIREKALSKDTSTAEEISDNLDGQDIPFGDDGEKEMRKIINEKLNDLPPKHWTDVNKDLVDEHESTADSILDEYENDIRSDVNQWAGNDVEIVAEVNELGRYED